MFKKILSIVVFMSSCLALQAQAANWGASVAVDSTVIAPVQLSTYLAGWNASATSSASGTCAPGTIYRYHAKEWVPRGIVKLYAVTVYEQTCS